MSHETKLREVRPRRAAGVRAIGALDRDARAPELLDAPRDASERMRALHVVIVGLGSVGCYLADWLARTTVASLVLIDSGRIKPESVLTHPVHPRAIGRAKATLAGERAKAVSPATRVRVYDGPVEELSLAAFVDASAVLLASDNLACELEVSQRCLHLGLPLIQASVHGPTLVAQVRSLAGHVDGQGPCLACGYHAADWEALDRGTRFSCAGGPAQNAPRATSVPTVSPPQLCAMAASLAVTELMGKSAGIHPATESRLVEICGFTQQTTVTPLARHSECPADHAPLKVVAWPRQLASATPRQLFEAAGCSAQDELDEVALTAQGYRFARLGACACPQHPVLGRFLPLAIDAPPCAGCGLPLECHPFYTHDLVPGGVLRPHLDRSLRELGVDDPSTVLVRRPDVSFLYHAAPRAGAKRVTRDNRPSNSPTQKKVS